MLIQRLGLNSVSLFVLLPGASCKEENAGQEKIPIQK